MVIYGKQLDTIENEQQMKDLIVEVDSMKVKLLEFYLSTFQSVLKISGWKKMKKSQKQQLLKVLLEKGEHLALMENPNLFRS